MDKDNIARLLADLAKIGEVEKCRSCHCYLDVLRQVQEDILSRGLAGLPEAETLNETIGRAHQEQSHGCLGCDPCFPVEPFNAFNELMKKNGARDACCSPAPPDARPLPECLPGWPPLPGDYTVLNGDASGAVCTLADETLYETLRNAPLPGVGIIGMLTTENLGIERLVRNVIASPRISWLLLCGTDSRGHRAGDSLAALAANGVDSEMRIVGAPGKRARLINLSPEAVDTFRRDVRVVPRTGLKGVEEISRLLRELENLPSAGRTGTYSIGDVEDMVGAEPESPPDPTGYFVIDVSGDRNVIRVEHHTPDHRITAVLVGKNARDLYLSAIRRGLVSRFDHAAYLGCELGKAERALTLKIRYIQDRPDT